MIICGDCLEEMKKMEQNSIDFIVTDPPYGLHFMGKDWDHGIPGKHFWEEALRICKPGSMLALFGGTRTYHRLACAIEDAGWEIRDCMMWIFGQGFPKSHNFGKKLGGDWNGYGTALKPAYEPIILAMKPLDGTFAQNAEKWGVAGINVDDSRIMTRELKAYSPGLHRNSPASFNDDSWKGKEQLKEAPKGRWPSNVILDEEAAEQLDEQSGMLKTGSMKPQTHEKKNSVYSKWKQASPSGQQGSFGGASRFFYCAKASPSERTKENNHPTVKPIALMKYIIKLLAPPGNPILLDPFCGSGSTLVAAKELGIKAIGIEKQKDYCEITKKRIESIEMNLFNYKNCGEIHASR